MKRNALIALDTSIVAPAGDELDPEQLALVTGGGVAGHAVRRLVEKALAVVLAVPGQWAKGSPYNEIGLVN